MYWDQHIDQAQKDTQSHTVLKTDLYTIQQNKKKHIFELNYQHKNLQDKLEHILLYLPNQKYSGLLGIYSHIDLQNYHHRNQQDSPKQEHIDYYLHSHRDEEGIYSCTLLTLDLRIILKGSWGIDLRIGQYCCFYTSLDCNATHIFSKVMSTLHNIPELYCTSICTTWLSGQQNILPYRYQHTISFH